MKLVSNRPYIIEVLYLGGESAIKTRFVLHKDWDKNLLEFIKSENINPGEEDIFPRFKEYLRNLPENQERRRKDEELFRFKKNIGSE